MQGRTSFQGPKKGLGNLRGTLILFLGNPGNLWGTSGCEKSCFSCLCSIFYRDFTFWNNYFLSKFYENCPFPSISKILLYEFRQFWNNSDHADTQANQRFQIETGGHPTLSRYPSAPSLRDSAWGTFGPQRFPGSLQTSWSPDSLQAS